MLLHAGPICRTALATVLGLAIASLAPAAEALPQGTLSGFVTDSMGKPVAGALVFIDDFAYDTGTSHSAATTLSRTDGSFQLGPLDPVYRNDKQLRVTAEGFAPQTAGAAITVFAGADANVGEIRLDRGQVIGGQVLDSDGKPRAGAVVQCQARRYFTAAFGSPVTPTYRLTADREGRFLTPPLPVSFAGLTVRVPGRDMPWVRTAIGPDGRADVGPIRLRPSTPIAGTVYDATGNPLARVALSAWDISSQSWLNCEKATTDPAGRFVLDGLGNRAQMLITPTDYVGINWVLHREADGIHWGNARENPPAFQGPVRELTVRLQPVAWISGQAIDADSGQPVHLDQIVRCSFDRKPNGEVILNGCASPDFAREPDGTFRVPYEFADEYHLKLTAAGYDDAEAFTPPVKELQPVNGIIVKMHKSKDGQKQGPARQTVSGTVQRDGKPVQVGWVALTRLRGEHPDKVNADIRRGRTVTHGATIYARSPVRDGMYTLNVPYQGDDWGIEMQEPGQALTQLSGIAIGLGESKRLDISAVHGGSIRGHVDAVPATWANVTWVVAFTRNGSHFEQRIGAGGSFSFAAVPPDEYGLKAGHDAFLDAERPPLPLKDDDFNTPADPWKRATIVKVVADGVVTDVRLSMPGS